MGQVICTSTPNSQVTVEASEERELFAFQIPKPKIRSKKIILNMKTLSDLSEEKVTSLTGKEMV